MVIEQSVFESFQIKQFTYACIYKQQDKEVAYNSRDYQRKIFHGLLFLVLTDLYQSPFDFPSAIFRHWLPFGKGYGSLEIPHTFPDATLWTW